MTQAFLDRHGITHSWVVRQLNIPDATFAFYCGGHGFPSDIAMRTTAIIRDLSRRLSKFKFSNDNTADFDFLKDECGIQHRHLGKQLGVRASGSLAWKVQRGLSQEERAILIALLRETATACKEFEIGDDNIRGQRAA